MTQLLRVHGGELGGRRLSTPKGIRPSQGVVKEAIFNVLAAEVEGARVLDLFAGSGALGIEALSRGAAQATFVESEPRVVAVLKRNLAGLGLDGRARVVIADAARWSELHPTEVGKADLVLLDPPYGDAGLLAEVLAALDRSAAGTVVLEWSGKGPLPDLERLEVHRDRGYGATRLTILSPR
ncbi:MAG: 16S rRNA (guanine(966)-N(2))-methyltransferase RsmD [Chloroflexi bacterium]|nr:MAG: 16S rRNA (guanine(966)-N(2))-methyltransferase RsmD [Chloroflexota bacterium]TMD55438.1 MAG: 16S rRNA (guanine(966)-N(2))-methyltransferase RsmD [Chloroflexota bacterium]